MKLSHLRDIVAVADTGSLRGAGRQLGIAQPAITRSIREIEHELGTSLFERHAKGVRLTRIGETFLRRAVTVQSELRRASEEIEQLKGRSIGQVSIALSSASGIALMPSVLASFHRRFPDALLKVSESLFRPVEAEIASGETDFYVGPVDETITTQLQVEKLFDNTRLVFARRGHPLLHARTLAELGEARWIRPSFSTQYSEADFEAMFARAGLPPPKTVMHTRSLLMTILAVAHSDLLTILPIQWLQAPGNADRVAALDLVEQLHAAPVCIVRRRDLPLTPLAEYLCDQMRKVGANYGRRQLGLHTR